MWTLIEAPIPNAPEGKYISQIPSPTNLLTTATALKSIGISDIEFKQFLKERHPPIVKSENIVYNMGEATCMSYLYNYAIEYLQLLINNNPNSSIYLTGYHTWLYPDILKNISTFTNFDNVKITTPYIFENEVIGKTDGAIIEYHNDWSMNDWPWMSKNVCGIKGIRATIRASRGCPQHCKMCPVPIVYDHGIIRNSVDWVIEEIDELYHHYNIREIGFLDDNLFADKKWGYELLMRIINKKYKGLKFTFEEGLTVPQACDETLVSLLKDAKFYHIKLGIEALDKETLDFIQKPYRDPAQAIKAIKLLQKYKLNPTCFICIGFPTNTEESIKRDIDTFIKLGVKLRVQILYPYPGIDFAGKSISAEKLKLLQKYAMNETGSSAWHKV